MRTLRITNDLQQGLASRAGCGCSAPGSMTVMPDPSLSYAVGDVHGRDDLLRDLLAQIDAHAAGRDHRLIFLGDYIDRGPYSAAVVSRLMALQQARPPSAVICLRGNHEQMALDALAAGGGWQVNFWRRNGGDATLASYAPPGEEPELGHVSEEHRAWFATLPLSYQDAQRIYVHAGLEPHTPLAEQEDEVLLWIREAFLRAPEGSFPAHVVHGHTPTWAGKPDWADPELLAHRTNLDTGAYQTGVLTAGLFVTDVPGGVIKLLQARGSASDD